MVFGLILIAIGIIALLVKLDVLTGSIWSYVWPAILIILGLSFLFGRVFRRRHWQPWRWFGCCPPWDDRDTNKKE
jgi:hypothetical protein